MTKTELEKALSEKLNVPSVYTEADGRRVARFCTYPSSMALLIHSARKAGWGVQLEYGRDDFFCSAWGGDSSSGPFKYKSIQSPHYTDADVAQAVAIVIARVLGLLREMEEPSDG